MTCIDVGIGWVYVAAALLGAGLVLAARVIADAAWGRIYGGRE